MVLRGKPLSLDGQVALVTGASAGIGAAIARAYAAAGAAVGVNYRSGADAARALVDEIARGGGRATAIGGDVSDEAQVLAMFERLAEAYGRIDVLVANAGLQRDAPLAELKLEDWNAVVSTNLTGQYLCLREAVRRFRAQGPTPHSRALGKIICISSVHDVIPWAGHANYAASKGGVDMLMKTVAQEVAPRRIRVNSISPGAIATHINRDERDSEEERRKLLQLIPYGRIGEPDDVARAALWLACDDSDYVTGTSLVVDGGMSLYPAFAANG